MTDPFKVRDAMASAAPDSIPKAGRHAREVAALLTMANDAKLSRQGLRLRHVWLDAAAKAIPASKLKTDPNADCQTAEQMIITAQRLSDMADELLRQALAIIKARSVMSVQE